MNDLRHVVVVDDHTMVRKGLVSLINLFPTFKVLFEAGNGIEFIRQLDMQQLPNIVLLDIGMPEMDGFETAKWIRANHPGIKILALSTMDSETAIIRMVRCGANGYLLKDADTDELKRALNEVISLGFFYNENVTRKIMKSIHTLVQTNAQSDAFEVLSKRELEFVRLACSEKTYQQIAADMFVSQRTVDGYRDSLFEKLNVASRVGLVLYAIRNKIVEI